MSELDCRLAVACLEETIAHFIAALLTYTKSITDAFLKQVERDREQICDFFDRHCIREKVRHSWLCLSASAVVVGL
jgi:hypothetical protein